jgi:hypothetical protein
MGKFRKAEEFVVGSLWFVVPWRWTRITVFDAYVGRSEWRLLLFEVFSKLNNCQLPAVNS